MYKEMSPLPPHPFPPTPGTILDLGMLCMTERSLLCMQVPKNRTCNDYVSNYRGTND